MAGVLTICSNGTGQLLSGHSWIVYQPDGEPATTYGTWGNNPGGLGNGLHRNLEAGRIADASRSVRLDDQQQAELFKTIKRYEDKGPDGWQYLAPCSTFAADAWQSATGEKLQHRSGMLISNPSRLKQSIEEVNGIAPAQAVPVDERPASQSSLGAPVSRCPISSG